MDELLIFIFIFSVGDTLPKLKSGLKCIAQKPIGNLISRAILI